MFRAKKLGIFIVLMMLVVANASQKISSTFSIGIGMCQTGWDGSTPVYAWTTTESTSVNTPQRQGEFTFVPTVSSVLGSGAGWFFPNRVPADLGDRGAVGYDSSNPAESWAMTLNASYNGDKGTGGKITVNITSMSIYGSPWTGVGHTLWFTETTLGHESTSPVATTPTYVGLKDPASYAHLIWNPTDFEVAGESATRTFGIDESSIGYMMLDGFEITGNVVYEYDEPVILPAPKDSNDFDYKWEADSIPTLIWGDTIDSETGEPLWTVNGDGTVTIVQNYQEALVGWDGLDLPKWTIETRMKVDAPKADGVGVYHLCISDGSYMYGLIVDSGRIYDQFAPSNLYIPVSFTDEFHTIRIAKHASGEQNIYLDGMPISYTLTAIPVTEKSIGCGSGTVGIHTGTVTVDYFRLDTTDAFAPMDVPAANTKPIIPTANDFSESLGMVAFYFFGPESYYVPTGAKLWRQDLHWYEYETSQGVYEFGENPTMPGLDLYGQTAILILGGQNQLYADYVGNGEFPIPPAQQAGFCNFAAAAASYFKGKRVIFELLNEPDGTGGCTGSEYAAFAKAVAVAMRAADPNVIIAGPAAHVYATSWIDAALAEHVEDAFDLFTVHLYTGDGYSPQPQPEEVGTLVASVKAKVAASHKPAMPVACSEWGYKRYIDPSLFTPPTVGNNNGAVTEIQQRDYLPRSFMLTQLWDLRFDVWFCWNSGMNNAEAGFGLMNSNITSPAYDAMTNMTAQLPAANLIQRINVGNSNDYVLEFSTSKGNRWAVWTKDAAHNVSFNVGTGNMISVVDITGSATNHITPSANTITIQASEAVQYVYKTKLLNFAELAEFADFWQATDCAGRNDCDGYDYEPDGNVDLADLESFCSEWLTPVD